MLLKKKKPNININKGDIALKNVTFSYPGRSEPIIKDLNLYIGSGTRIGLFGKSGSGKTTIMKLILGFHKLDKGNIYIDSQNINKFNSKSIRDHISFANQNGKLFNGSILYNVCYGTNKSEESIKQYMKSNNLLRFFSNLPNGIHSLVGVNGMNLSRGQRQIIILIRSIIKDTKILMVDEPTTGLDANTKNSVLHILKNIDKNRTLIVVSHDKEILPIIERVHNMNK